MPTEIKCPSCAHVFPMEDAMAEDYKKELREKMIAFTKENDVKLQKRMAEIEIEKQHQQKDFDARLLDQQAKLKRSIEENLRKTIGEDFENQMLMLQGNAKENEEKLKSARAKELDYLRKEQALKIQSEEMELAFTRKMQEQQTELVDRVRKQEAEKNSLKDTEHQMRLRELEKQLADQKKLAEEAVRKARQGSMQLQGEVQELALEELLRTNFPFDIIEEVGKGVRGADCVQIVRNQFGQESGKIIYESKRTKEFGGDWVEKLKKDMRSQGVDVAVIVSQCYPKGMECFGQKDGVWVCSFDEVNAVAYVLREGILRMSAAMKSQENRGDKMHMLYDYLTGSEFSEQWKAIREGFLSMKMSIQKERDAMERLWKSREKQLEKVLLNATHIRGSIEGISGTDSIQLSLTDDDDETLLLD
ncbi:hypothetical protein ACVWYG_002401 [Pedobacter sp. UYEF25]